MPADVGAFIARHLDSVVQLELLLLFHRAPERSWTAAEAARELRVETTWTAGQSEQLARHGLIRLVDAESAAYQFATDPADRQGVVDRLAQLYASRRMSVIAAIYAKPAETLRTFADAFRIRKEGRDG